MSRPEFLPCIMTPGIISAIKSDQDRYDCDPERYEAEERRKLEEWELERQALREEYERQK